jgi:hypothetical protein
VSPRRHRRAVGEPPPLDPVHARHGVESVQADRDGEWLVRAIPGDAAAKTYRCPGCDQEIPPGVPHLVVWPADEHGAPDDRRHWHTGCWRARATRWPRIIRRR